MPDRENHNKANRVTHSANLKAKAAGVVSNWNTRQQRRRASNLPSIPANIPLFVEVEPGTDLEFLRRHFNLEIVSEHEDGIVIVASSEQDMATFLDAMDGFANERRGTSTAAKIYDIKGTDERQFRLERLLSESFLEKWPSLDDAAIYTVDVGVECLGEVSLPDPPEQDHDEDDDHFANRLAKWRRKKNAAEATWDDLKESRELELIRFVAGYAGEVLDMK